MVFYCLCVMRCGDFRCRLDACGQPGLVCVSPVYSASRRHGRGWVRLWRKAKAVGLAYASDCGGVSHRALMLCSSERAVASIGVLGALCLRLPARRPSAAGSAVLPACRTAGSLWQGGGIIWGFIFCVSSGICSCLWGNLRNLACFWPCELLGCAPLTVFAMRRVWPHGCVALLFWTCLCSFFSALLQWQSISLGNWREALTRLALPVLAVLCTMCVLACWRRLHPVSPKGRCSVNSRAYMIEYG